MVWSVDHITYFLREISTNSASSGLNPECSSISIAKNMITSLSD